MAEISSDDEEEAGHRANLPLGGHLQPLPELWTAGLVGGEEERGDRPLAVISHAALLAVCQQSLAQFLTEEIVGQSLLEKYPAPSPYLDYQAPVVLVEKRAEDEVDLVQSLPHSVDLRVLKVPDSLPCHFTIYILKLFEETEHKTGLLILVQLSL